MGYDGFMLFRNEVAKQVSGEFEQHYLELNSGKVMMLYGEKRKKFFVEYDKKTDKLIEEGKVSLEVAVFLYRCDCEGKITRQQAKKVYELIKNCDDNIPYGYTRRDDCATMKDMKKIFSDNTKVEWR